MADASLDKEPEGSGGYLPGDPRYGLTGDALKDYYRQKPAQWVILCLDKAGSDGLRNQHYPAHRSYLAAFAEHLIGYGPLVSDDGADEIGYAFFVELPDRNSAEAFVADEPFSRAGVYDSVSVVRWSNSFLNRMDEYELRPARQLFLLIASKRRGIEDLLRERLHDHESYFKRFEEDFVFRGPIRSEDGTVNFGSAIVIELPNRAAMDDFWDNEPYNKNGVYQDDLAIYRWQFGNRSSRSG